MGAQVPRIIHRWRETLPAEVVAIAVEVAEELGVSVEQFFDGHSDHLTRRGRQQIMARLRARNKNLTFQKIAGFFQVDHSTVHLATKRFTAENTEADCCGIHRSNLREASRFLNGQTVT